MRAGFWVVALWLGAHVLLVACSFFEVFVYSIAVAPGLEQADYEAHARTTAPWVSIVCGGPLFFAWGRVLRARLGESAVRAGGAVWALYTATDLALVTASGAWAWLLGAQWVVSQSVKGIGMALGVARTRGDSQPV